MQASPVEDFIYAKFQDNIRKYDFFEHQGYLLQESLENRHIKNLIGQSNSFRAYYYYPEMPFLNRRQYNFTGQFSFQG